MRKLPAIVILLLLTHLMGVSAWGQDTRIGHSGYPVPRFVNLKNDQTNARVGPSFTYPVRYDYKRRHLPLRVIAETTDNVWRQVEDAEGVKSWIHRTQLVSSDMVMVIADNGAVMRKTPDQNAKGRAQLQKGVIVKAEECNQSWCRVRNNQYRGWVLKSALWGAN